MPVSSSDQLKEQIESIPVVLRKALEQQAKARIAVAHLEAQIGKLEAEIERENSQEDNDDDDSEYDELEDSLELIKLESNVERLKLQVTEAEDKAEMAFRASIAKTTEGQVKAAVGTDSTVMKLRNKFLDAKEAARERKITLQSEQQTARAAKLEARYATRMDVPPENEKLHALQEKLEAAEDALILADVEVEVIRTTVETYKMLVQLS